MPFSMAYSVSEPSHLDTQTQSSLSHAALSESGRDPRELELRDWRYMLGMQEIDNVWKEPEFRLQFPLHTATNLKRFWKDALLFE